MFVVFRSLLGLLFAVDFLHWVGVAFYGVRGFSFVAWSTVCRGFLLVREGDRSCWFRLSGFS